MTDSVEEVAAKIRAAYAKGGVEATGGLTALFADKVEILHEPLQKQDGVWDAQAWAKAEHWAVNALYEAIPDFRQDVVVTVSGDEIRTENTSFTDSGSESGVLIKQALGIDPEGAGNVSGPTRDLPQRA